MGVTTEAVAGNTKFDVDESWMGHCQSRAQRDVVRAILDEGGCRIRAAEKLGCNRTNVQKILSRVAKNRARCGDSPEHGLSQSAAPGFRLHGYSTMLENAIGKPIWYKFSAEHERTLEVAREISDELTQSVARVEPIVAPESPDEDLLTLYPISDAHVGIMAWHREGNRDWDLSIAEDTLIGAVQRMMASSPSSETAVIGQLGDFLHFDSLVAETPTNRHPLDSDGRAGKVVAAAIKILRTIVDLALRKHRTVKLIVSEGNHDPFGSIWMRKLFGALYEQEPRFSVIDEESPYAIFRHGKTLLAFHHGHLKQPKGIPGLISHLHAREWGETEFRYAHLGHRHNFSETQEINGMRVTTHPTLAARDAYASRHGFASMAEATAISYHRDRGLWSTVTVRP